MFGWKLDRQGPSSIGGESLGPIGGKSTMILDPTGPFVPSDGFVTSTPLGTITPRCLGPGATEALAALSTVRTAAVLSGQDSRRSRRSYRSPHSSMDPELEARLARLGIGACDADLTG
jgi:hypothetical protein